MKHIQQDIPHQPWHSKLFDFYFKDRTLGVLDIETTGLNPAKNHFVLGGLLVITNNSSTLHQFFAEELSQERETLIAFLNAIKQVDFLLTYNGKHFDLPFIQKRSGIEPVALPYNLDLYLVLNGHSSLKPFLPNLKQKTVENFMGLWSSRTDEISGKESVDLYYTYLENRNPEAMRKILLHNSDDVVQLYRLLPILQKTDFHKAMYHLGFPVAIHSHPGLTCKINKIAITGSRLSFSGVQTGSPIDYIIYEDNYHAFTLTFKKREKTFRASIPLIRRSGLAVADAAALNLNLSLLEKYPSFSQGLLVVENHGVPQYMEINHLIKQLLERI